MIVSLKYMVNRMNYWTMNNRNFGIAALVSFLTVFVLLAPVANADSNVKSIRHDPNTSITSSDDVTIYITLENSDNISSIEYQYCEVDPVGTCSIYKDMTDEGNDQYSGVIPANDGGTTMGYKVKIEYDDGSKEYSPNEDSYHEYYIEEDEKDNDDSSFIPTPIVITPLLLAVALIHFIGSRKKTE
jgi:hypothetical protein